MRFGKDPLGGKDRWEKRKRKTEKAVGKEHTGCFWHVTNRSQAVWVTRFDQSEWFSYLERAVFRGVCGEIFALFRACVGNFDCIRRGKLLEHFILIAVALLFNILLSWAFLTSLDCSVTCRPPWWCECYFRRSSWIHCWLLLAVLSDYFGQLVTSTFLLCKFWGLPGSTPVSFPVMRRWKCLGMKRLSQPSSKTPGKRAEKLAEVILSDFGNSILQCEMWSSVWMNINRVTLQNNKEFIMFIFYLTHSLLEILPKNVFWS